MGAQKATAIKSMGRGYGLQGLSSLWMNKERCFFHGIDDGIDTDQTDSEGEDDMQNLTCNPFHLFLQERRVELMLNAQWLGWSQ